MSPWWETKAKALAQKAWIDLDMPAGVEPGFLRLAGALLTEADHKRRLDRLLLNDARWTVERNERAAVIRRTIALLSEEEKKKAEARLAVFLRAKNSQKLLSKLLAHSQVDWGLAVQKAQALRRQKKEEEAWKILLAEPEGAAVAKPDGRGSAAPTPTRRCGSASPEWLTISRAVLGCCRSMPARTPHSWPAGWRCATSRTPSWRSAISRRSVCATAR